MAVVQTQTVKVLTLNDMRQKYRSNLAMATRLGLKEWFITQFGSESKFLSQFKRMPYDAEAV